MPSSKGISSSSSATPGTSATRPGARPIGKDSERIADLVRHGLIAKSFAPRRPLRELRELLRHPRKLVVESQAAERTRLLKLL
jgi:hypothetical protein